MSPASNLLIALAAVGLLLVLLRPQHGWLWKWSRRRRQTERIRIEDALKHLYDREYEGHPGTVESLAEALSIDRDEARRLTTRLESLSLLTADEQGLHLTAEGRGYALRVIRIHRLLEVFLADRTGVQEADWHRVADRREHAFTERQAELLSSQLGHPTYDPHGDPIPTASGAMPEHAGRPLPELPAGSVARIVHVEDEPEVVYAQLVAARLHPGVTVRVLENEPDRLRIEAEMQEHVLAPIVAANLTVELLAEAPAASAPGRRLSSLAVGEQARVVDLSAACRGVERRRLLDLGIVPGTVIRAELQSVAGDPTAYRIRGAMIALRRDQADMVYVLAE